MSTPFTGIVAAADTAQTVRAFPQPARRSSGPIRFYEGQDLAGLFTLIPHCVGALPAIDLRIGMVEDATVFVQPGYDGVVLDREGRAIRETTFYSTIWQQSQQSGEIGDAGAEYEVDDLFISFDGAWHVFYHWIVFGFGAAAVAGEMLDPAIPIGIPSYDDRLPLQQVLYSKEVQEQSLAQLGIDDRVRFLPRGRYKVRRAYILYVAGGQNTDMTFHPVFRSGFQRVAHRATENPILGGPGRRIFISRARRGTAGRITESEEAHFAAVAGQHGFTTVFLEELSFMEQVRAFAEAEAVLAPHGSGLASLLFSRPGTKVIELSRDVDSNTNVLRPWFYVIAEGGGLPYVVLDAGAGDFSPERTAAALAAIGL